MNGSFQTILERVGNTPLVELKGSAPKPGVRLFAKLEYMNPSGSLKDRIVKFILEKAVREGALTPDKIVVEASSGNTGIAMGLIAGTMGFRSRVYMPSSKSRERRIMMNFYGVELVLTAADNPHSHIEACEELVGHDAERYFYLNQNGNENNSQAHYEGTGREILTDMGDESVDVFLAGLGTGGVLMGVGRRLKEADSRTRIIAVEPTQGISRIEGLLHLDGSYVPPIWHETQVDDHLYVPDAAAEEYTRLLARKEGIFAGISSGANYWAALQVAERLETGNIVFVCGDRGERYLSTPMCEGMDQGVDL